MSRFKRLVLMIAGIAAITAVGVALAQPAQLTTTRVDNSQSGDMSTWNMVHDQVERTIHEHHHHHGWHHRHHHQDWQQQQDSTQNDAQPAGAAPMPMPSTVPLNQPAAQPEPAAPAPQPVVTQPAETSAPQPQPSATSSSWTPAAGGPDSPCTSIGQTLDYTTPSQHYTDHMTCTATSWGNEYKITTRTNNKTGQTAAYVG